MITQQRGVDDQIDPWSSARSGRGGPGSGSLFLATLLGVGIGLLSAPQPGSKTRKLLLKRLAALGEDVGEGLEDVEKDHSSPVGIIVAIAAGLAATYFLTSDRAAPVRSRVQEAASDVKRRATDQWDRFQRGGTGSNRERSAAREARSESRAGSASADEAPQAS